MTLGLEHAVSEQWRLMEREIAYRIGPAGDLRSRVHTLTEGMDEAGAIDQLGPLPSWANDPTSSVAPTPRRFIVGLTLRVLEHSTDIP